MGTNQHRLDMLEKRVREVISETAAEHDARRIVAIWNGQRCKRPQAAVPPADRRWWASLELPRVPVDRRD
jgi:hypothetical protein